MTTTLVFLHGYGLDKRIWQINPLTNLDYPALYFDLDGYGESKTSAFSKLDQQASALLSRLKNMNISSIILIGHSMGGYIALEMLKMDRKRIRGVILLNSHPFADSLSKKEQRNKVIAHLQKNTAHSYKKFFAHSLFSKQFIDHNPNFFEKVYTIIQEQDVDHLISSLKAMRDRMDYSDLLSSIEKPVMIIHGNKDAIIPISLINSASALPQVVFCHQIELGSHMGMIENPQLIVHYIRSFYEYCHDD